MGTRGTRLPISLAVITLCTPGSARAAATAIERMRPWATELRRIAACSMSLRARSSTYCPRPRRKRKSSIRSIGLPMSALLARLESISDDNRGLLVAQRPRDAQGCERRCLGVGARRVSLQRDGKPSGGSLDLDLVHIAGRIGIGDELD